MIRSSSNTTRASKRRLKISSFKSYFSTGLISMLLIFRIDFILVSFILSYSFLFTFYCVMLFDILWISSCSLVFWSLSSTLYNSRSDSIILFYRSYTLAARSSYDCVRRLWFDFTLTVLCLMIFPSLWILGSCLDDITSPSFMIIDFLANWTVFCFLSADLGFFGG